MSLRTRLVLGLTIAFLVFAVAATFTVQAQRSQLYDQVDDQLFGTPLPKQTPTRPGAEGPPAQAVSPPSESITQLYLAKVNVDGTVEVVIESQTLTDRPLVQELVDEAPSRPTLRTVDGEYGSSQFRLLYAPPTDPGMEPRLVALPLDNVEATARQLVYIFVGIALLMALVLGLVGYWVNRFGIAPITKMTGTAEAIAGGERARRAENYSASTEAGRLASAFNVMLDERDEAEDRLRKFVSNASHELRTPLTSIRGYLDLYVEGGFRQPGQMDDAVRRMQVESARMNLLVEDLLLLAKLDEQQALQRSPLDIGAMLNDVAASALAAKPDRAIDISIATDPAREQLIVDADPLRLQQAVAVLVDNAMTHTPPETELTLAAQSTDTAVSISVIDDGPGIAADDLNRVFDRFYRADASRSRSSGGSGLGLAIAKAIVEAHGATITVDSALGRGTTFTITMPKAADASSRVGSSASAAGDQITTQSTAAATEVTAD